MFQDSTSQIVRWFETNEVTLLIDLPLKQLHYQNTSILISNLNIIHEKSLNYLQLILKQNRLIQIKIEKRLKHFNTHQFLQTVQLSLS